MNSVETQPRKPRKCMSDDIWMTCKDYKFIEQDYLKYQRYAALQRAQPGNEYFVETLVRGLQRLENLSRVIFDDWWFPYRRVLDATEGLIPRRPAGRLQSFSSQVEHLSYVAAGLGIEPAILASRIGPRSNG